MSDLPPRPTVQFLKKSEDFARVKRIGIRRQTPYFNLVHSPTPEARTSFGIVVGRRFGNAVKRNRAKRIVRELVRGTKNSVVSGKDCIVFPRRKLLQVSHPTLKIAWVTVLSQEKFHTNTGFHFPTWNWPGVFAQPLGFLLLG